MAEISKINLGGIDYNVRDKVLEKEVANIKPIINQGTINNAADEEDITSVNSLLKLRDRAALNGMGYIILRKNKSFAEQVTQANTIYELRYDFDLSKNAFSMPQNCVLYFNGGSIENGTIIFANTFLFGDIQISCKCEGKISNESCSVRWFNAKADGTNNDTMAFQSAIAICDFVNVPSGEYLVTLQKRSVKAENDINGICITRSNVTIKMASDAIIKGEVDKSVSGYNGYSNYYGNIIKVLSIDAESLIENIVIDGGVLIGVRGMFAAPKGSANEENQCGISFERASNCVVRNCVIRDNQGDSVVAYDTIGLVLENITSINTRRSGISVGPCKNLTVDSCSFVDNGCDVEYNGAINYATGPCAAICFEGDSSSELLERKFKNVIIKNCRCEFHTAITPPNDYVFVARNAPVFVLLGQVSRGGENFKFENNDIVNIDSANSSAFLVSSSSSAINEAIFARNRYESKVKADMTKNSAMFQFTASNISNIIIDSCECTTSTRMLFIYGSTNKFGHILLKNNKSIKVEDVVGYYTLSGVSVETLSFANNYIVSDNFGGDFDSIDKLEFLNNNIVLLQTDTNGAALIGGKLPNNAKYIYRGNVCQMLVKEGFTLYIFKCYTTNLDNNGNVVSSSEATQYGGPDMEVVGNSFYAEGKNFYWANFPIMGVFANNNVKTNVSTWAIWPPEKPLSRPLYIINNVFDNKGNTENRPIVTSEMENIIHEDNVYVGRKHLGENTDRPNNMFVTEAGYFFFSKTLGKPIWWNGSQWVDATGTKV